MRITNAALYRAVIQKCPRGVTPSRTITAPEPCERASLLTEEERLATFERSRTFHAAPVSPDGHSPVAERRAGAATHRFHYAD